MKRQGITWIVILSALSIGAFAAALGRPRPAAPVRERLPLVQGTLRSDLDATIAIAKRRLAADPADAVAAVRLAEVLLRKERIETNGGYATEAANALEDVLDRQPSEYSALKMLAAAYADQHRFREAVEVAKRAIAVKPEDAWNYGVMGDAYIELGERERAYDAFDLMVAKRPDAASYSRVAYAQELQGHFPEALRTMRMAIEATSAHDPESLACHYAQAGTILLKMGDVDGAAREFSHADFVYPGHPYARNGLAKVAAARAAATNTASAAPAPVPESGNGTRRRVL